MKKTALIIFCILCVSVGYSQKRFAIQGTLTKDSLKWEEGVVRKIYLSILNKENGLDNLDSCDVVGGKFHFEGIQPEPMIMYYLSGFDNGQTILFPDSENMTVLIDAQYPAGGKVTGSRTTDLFKYYQKTSRSRTDSAAMAWNKAMKASKPEGWYGTPEGKKYSSFLFVLSQLEYELAVLEFCLQNPGEPVAAHVADRELVGFFSHENMGNMFANYFSTSISDHPYYKSLKSHMYVDDEKLEVKQVSRPNAKKCVVTGELTNNNALYTGKKIDKLMLQRVSYSGKTCYHYADVVDNKFSFEFEYTGEDPSSLMFIKGFDNGDVILFPKQGETHLSIDARYPNRCKANNRQSELMLSKYYDLVHDVYSDMENKKAAIIQSEHFKQEDLQQTLEYIESETWIRLNANLLEFIIENRDNPDMLPIFRDEYISKMNPRTMQMKRFKNIVSPELADNPIVKEIHDHINGMILSVGGGVPDFTLNDTKGKPITLSSYFGGFILLNVWDSKNADCVENMKYLKKLSDENIKNEDFVIISLSTDDDTQAWKKFVKKNKLSAKNWIHVNKGDIDHVNVWAYYRGGKLPHNYFVDPSAVLGIASMTGEEMVIDINRILSGDLFYRTGGKQTIAK